MKKDVNKINLFKKIIEKKTPSKKTNKKKNKIKNVSEWFLTGVPGLDDLFGKGIPKGNSLLIAGGAGSGKTILCLQILNNSALKNERCLYISLEESEDHLKKHMQDFGWNYIPLEKKRLLKIQRINPFVIAREIEALLAQEKGELKMNIHNVKTLFPSSLKPTVVVIDSLTALSSAFKDDETAYRMYIEQLFNYLEKIKVTSFLISETEQIPTTFSQSGVEEFLADGVVVLYNIKHDTVREHAIEVLKLRGAAHKQKTVPFQILPKKGIVVYPDQEVFSDIKK